MRFILNCSNHHILGRGICKKTRLWACAVVVHHRNKDGDSFDVLISKLCLRPSKNLETNYRPFYRRGDCLKRTETASPKSLLFIILVDESEAFDFLQVCVDLYSSLIVIDRNADGLAVISDWVHPSKRKRLFATLSREMCSKSSEMGFDSVQTSCDAILYAAESCFYFIRHCEIFRYFRSKPVCFSLERRLTDADLTPYELSMKTERHE